MTKYKGCSYPLLRTTKGFFHCGDDIAQLKASLLIILQTKPGERVCELNFGTPFHLLNFNQPMELLINQAQHMIAASVKRWEKRVQIDNIKCNFSQIDDGYDLDINISFIDPYDLQKMHKLSLRLPVGRGNSGKMPI